MKTYNIISKHSDLVITISGNNEDEAIDEVNNCMLEGYYYIQEVEEW